MGPVCAHCCSIPLSKPRASALAVSTECDDEDEWPGTGLENVGLSKNSQHHSWHHSALLIARGRIRLLGATQEQDFTITFTMDSSTLFVKAT